MARTSLVTLRNVVKHCCKWSVLLEFPMFDLIHSFMLFMIFFTFCDVICVLSCFARFIFDSFLFYSYVYQRIQR